MNEKWDGRFLEMARHVSSWSKDPSTGVGAIVVQKRRVKSTGYNGFPPGIADDDRLDYRTVKYRLTVHAEMNALIQAGNSCEGATLYLWGMPGPPCSECAKHIIAAGIARVVSRDGDRPERWADTFELSEQLLEEAGVEYVEL